MTTLNVARVYLRVSTEDQDLQREQGSLRLQIAHSCDRVAAETSI
ncbi:hypothetical protein ALQ10_200103 [Pseudomonas savastanoi pv. glycinea]|nr:hypothetical protein ALQ10_200103 [Pseudomonas savastanoi pv. glycinea]